MTYQTKSTVVIIISILLFIVSIGVALGFVWPALIDLDSAKLEKAQKTEELSAKQNLLGSVQSLVAQYQSLDSKVLADIARAVPQGQNIPDLLVQIEGMAAESNLVVESANFTPFTLQGGASNLSVKAVQADMNLKGGYPGFSQWLKLLESNLRLMSVKSFSFNLVSAGGNIFTLKIKFLAYYQ